MSRDELVYALARIAHPYTLGMIALGIDRGGTPTSDAAAEWVDFAKPEWLGLVLDIIANPPDLSGFDAGVKAGWEEAVVCVLAHWMIRDPEFVLPVLGEKLEDARFRTWILSAFAETMTKIPGALLWLTPLAESVTQLTDYELSCLVSALVLNRPDNLAELLARMQQLLPLERKTAHQEIAPYAVSKQHDIPTIR